MNTKTPLGRQVLVSLLALFLLACGGFYLTRQGKEGPKEASAPKTDTVAVSQIGQSVVEVETAAVRAVSLPGTLQTTGQILFSTDQSVKISPRVQGRVRQVFVRVGDHVTAGQPLLILDSVDAATAQTTARQNENKLRQADANLERQQRLYRLGTLDVTSAEAALDQARANAVAAKDVVVRTREQERIGGFTQKPLEDAENAVVMANSALSQARSDADQAQRDYDRKTKLVEIGVSAKSDQEAALNTLEKTRTSVQADQESVRLAHQALDREQKAFKSNLYGDQQVRQAESAFRLAELQQAAAERALRLARTQILRDLQQAKSDDQAARYDYQNSMRSLELLGKPQADGTLPIKAPISGVVTERNVSPGQVVDQSQMTPWQMLTISNSDRVWVDADVYEKDIESVRIGQAVRIHVAAFPDRQFSGVLYHIAPTLDPKTRAIKVRAEIANPGGLLKDGMYADVTLVGASVKSSVAVPLAAVQHDGDSDYVYVAQKGKYTRRAVRLGAQRNDVYLVDKGLEVGERVVTHGGMFLGGQTGGG